LPISQYHNIICKLHANADSQV